MRVTPWFAPSGAGEKVEIEYNIENLEDERVMLEVVDRGGQVVYFRELLGREKKAPLFGLKEVEWTGQGFDGSYVTPFGSPFTVHLYAQTVDGGTKRTQVLVASVEIVMAPWDPKEELKPNTAAPGAPTAYARWRRFKLNHLGYFAGPVDAALGPYETNATRRYRAGHNSLVKRWHADYDNLSVPDAGTLRTALADNDNPRPYFTKPSGRARAQLSPGDKLDQGGGTTLRVHVESLWWMAEQNHDEMVDQYPDLTAPAAVTRLARDQARLNRPLVPIEAVIKLKGMNGQPKVAPLGTGPLRFVWSAVEPQEDLSLQFADRPDVCSYPRRYVERCLRLAGGRTGPTNNNCQPIHGGIRGTPPFLMGAQYPPYTATAAGATAETLAYTGAAVLGETYDKRRARAGLFFNPSFIAGDAYALTATLDLANLDPAQPARSDDTSPIQVWRFAKVAATINWPARDLGAAWPLVKAEYAAAYVDLDVSNIASLAATDVLSNVEYDTWFRTVFGGGSDTMKENIFSTAVKANALVNIHTIPRDDDPGMYLGMMVREDSFERLWTTMHTNTRRRHAAGMVLITYQIADPLQFAHAPTVSMSIDNGGISSTATRPGRPTTSSATRWATRSGSTTAGTR